MTIRKLSQLAYCLAFVAALAPLAAAQAPRLTLSQAVAMALEKNPAQKMSAAGVEQARAGEAMARTLYLPQISLSESVVRGDDPVFAFGTKLRQQVFQASDFSLDSLNRPRPSSDFTTSIAGRWTAFDSLRTQRQVKRAALLRQSAQVSASRSAQEVVFATVSAYQAVLIAARERQLAQHAAETAAALLQESRTRVAAGLAVDSDALSAQVNLARRQQELIRAQGDERSAWAALEAAVGAELPMDAAALEELKERTLAASALADEQSLALAKRPDLQSLALQISAQKAAVSSAKSSLGPRVDAFGSWQTDRHSLGGAGGSNWTTGAELRVDLLPAQQREQLRMERAGLQRVQAGEQLARNMIRVEVSRAYYGHESAAKMLEVARDARSQADESLRILRNRYDAGLTTLTEVLRAEDASRQSQSSYWQAVYQNALSYASLRLATGTLTLDEVVNLQ